MTDFSLRDAVLHDRDETVEGESLRAVLLRDGDLEVDPDGSGPEPSFALRDAVLHDFDHEIEEDGGVLLPAAWFDLNERALDGGTIEDGGTPLASDVLDAIPTWAAETVFGVAWGVQGEPGTFDIVAFVKRPSDDSVWASEFGGVGTYRSGGVEPDWDTDPESGVSDGDYTWYPVDASFPTIGAWVAEAALQPCRLVQAAGYVWASYPNYSGNSGTVEPDWASATVGTYAADGDGYWWPIGSVVAQEPTMQVLTVWPDQGAGGRNATLVANPGGGLAGFTVGTDHGHTTVTGKFNTGLTIAEAFPDADEEGNVATIMMLVTLADDGPAADGTHMAALTYDPAGNNDGPLTEELWSTDGDLAASRVVGAVFGAFDAQTGGPQPGETIIVTKVHNDHTSTAADTAAQNIPPRGLSHVDGFEATPQTVATSFGDITGPDVMVGNAVTGNVGFCGRIRRVVCYPGKLTAAQRLAARQMLAAQAAADGITVTLYDETDLSDIAIGWEPSNDTVTGLLDVWYVPDDATVGADVLSLVGAVNGEILSNSAAVGTVAERVGLDGVSHKVLVMDGSAPLIHPTKHTFAFTNSDTGKWWVAFVGASPVADERWLLGNTEMEVGGYVNGPDDGRALLVGNDSFFERAPHIWRTNYGDLDHTVAWIIQYDNTKRTLGDLPSNSGQGISTRGSTTNEGVHATEWRYQADTLTDATLAGADPANHFAFGDNGAVAAVGAGTSGANQAWRGTFGVLAIGTGSGDKAELNTLMAWMHRRLALIGPFRDLGSAGEVN